MNTTENNKLIAEFMGGLYNNQSRLSLQSNEIWLPYHGVCSYKSNNGKCLQYHSSWDWLIPVVEKIESLDFRVEIIDTRVDIEDFRGFEFSKRFEPIVENTKIEAVYNACVTFIEWYNSAQKEN